VRMSVPGSPGPAHAASWRRWLLPLAITAGFLALLALPRRAAPDTAVTYTRFLADVGAGTVHAVTIGPAGQVTGSLTGGQPFTTTIPVALGSNGLAGDLAAHHVQVTATAAGSSSLLSVLTGLLPLLAIGGLLFFIVRDFRRHAAERGGGGMGALMLLGTRHAMPLAPGELATVAVHEAGHALVAALCPHADPVSRVTVLGAGHALGLTEMLPAEDRRLYGESYLADTLAVRLAGRAAERLIRGEASTGASDDLTSATALAIQMVRDFGLSDKLGPVSYGDPPGGLSGPGPRSYSEHTQWLVDQEVATLLTGAESRARDLLTRHREALTQLTATLMEQETVSGDQVRALVQTTGPAALPAALPMAGPAARPAGLPSASSRS
jgi:ATP-dependent Zn protease